MAIFQSPYPSVPVSEESYATFLLKPESNPYPLDTVAYIDGLTDQTHTRKQHAEQVLALASGLRNAEHVGLLPLSRGSTVLVFSPNSILYPVVMMATGFAGIIPAYANSGYLAQELTHAYKISQSSHIIAHPSLLQVTLDALQNVGISKDEAKRRVILMSRKPDTPSKLRADGWKDFDDLVPDGRIPLPEKFDGAAAQEDAVIYFSSGTTGMNKAIVLSHRNVTSVLAMLAAVVSFYDHGRDVLIAVIPFYHIYGGHLLAFLSFMKGVPLVVLPRFIPEHFLSAVDKFKVTHLPLVPPLLTFLARHPLVDKYNLASIRRVVAGAAPVIPAMFDQCSERFAKRGFKIYPGGGYGMSETSGIVSLLSGVEFDQNKGSVGPLMPNMEGRLVGDDGDDVPIGSPGEIWLRGPNIVKQVAAECNSIHCTFTPDGWLMTGDVGVRNEGGFMWIVDRKKELIKYKGFQVAPAELEAILSDHPGVTDSGVVGIFSEEEGTELPRAYVVPKDLELLKKPNSLPQDVQEWLKGRVAHFKQLRGGVILVDSIPRSAAGKILRRNLRDQAQAHPMRAKL
ncbi:hypothetical protein NM688_g7099 [Phlebia brevispora]|uniref:Uncharacterized protein n=1 Tax=Phlebia brevispora TaxID=194682 RepID=A0ACC1S920_9APHY|nr:hypothetical protein NM688_g7099 [Phlebia brevispora]